MIEREGCRSRASAQSSRVHEGVDWSYAVSKAISEATQGKETDAGKWTSATSEPISDGVNHAHIVVISEKRTIFHLD